MKVTFTGEEGQAMGVSGKRTQADGTANTKNQGEYVPVHLRSTKEVSVGAGREQERGVKFKSNRRKKGRTK